MHRFRSVWAALCIATLQAALLASSSHASEFEVIDRLTVGGPTVFSGSGTVVGALGVGGSGLEGGSLVIRSTSTTGANPILDVRNSAGNPVSSFFENGDARFGSGVLKSTFPAVPGNTTYALRLSSGVRLADGCIEFDDGSLQCAAGGGGGLGSCPSDMAAVGSWCVDRFEASVWNSASCTGTQYGINGVGNDDYPAACNDNGAGCKDLIFACSLGPNTTKPSTWITWFRANIACANAGKELLPNAVWQKAATGTPDPGTDNSVCNVADLGTPANTGQLSTCVSDFGVYDMAGNVNEWTADWISGGTNYVNSGADGTSYNSWPAGYGSDLTWNMGTRASNGAWVTGLPSVMARGGVWGGSAAGAAAGVFQINAIDSPAYFRIDKGFRCGRRR